MLCCSNREIEEINLKNCCNDFAPIQANGFIVCRSCGCCGHRIVESQEVRQYNHDERVKREHREIISGNGMIHTIFYTKGKDVDSFKPHQQARFKRLAKVDGCLFDGYARNINDAIYWLNLYKVAYPMSDVMKSEALTIYKKVAKKGVCRGRNIKDIVAGVCFYVLKKTPFPPTFDKLADCYDMSANQLYSSFSIVKTNMNLPNIPCKIEQYLAGISSRMNVGIQIEIDSIKIAKEIQILTGVSPKGIAAAIFYVVAKKIYKMKEITQDIVAAKFDTTEVTLRKFVVKLEKDREKIVKIIQS